MEKFMKWWEGILMSNRKLLLVMVLGTIIATVIGVSLGG